MKIETREEIKRLVREGNMKFLLKTNDGRIVRTRFATTISNDVLIMGERKRRFGFFFDSEYVNYQDFFKVIKSRKKELTPAEKYCEDLIKYKRYLEKNLHPNLYEYWKEEIENINSENIKNFINAEGIKSHYDAWDMAPKFNLPRIEHYKTLSIKSCLPKYMQERVLREIKDALDNKKDYSISWRHNYDYSLEIVFKNNVGRAWLAQEYKNCGNGHYWLIIGENHCIFCEDD